MFTTVVLIVMISGFFLGVTAFLVKRVVLPLFAGLVFTHQQSELVDGFSGVLLPEYGITSTRTLSLRSRLDEEQYRQEVSIVR